MLEKLNEPNCNTVCHTGTLNFSLSGYFAKLKNEEKVAINYYELVLARI